MAKYARRLDGLLLLDKPKGLTSSQAVQQVKRLFRARKVGHTGSLDPLATGLLPLCFGEATKVSAFLLDADKWYDVECRFGQRTSTGDAEGEVVAERPVHGLDEVRLESALAQFRGPLEQIPPMYSAVKHQGTPLYKLARAGQEVVREPRMVVIHRLQITSFEAPYVRLSVHCSKGTYVRTLVEDIGEAVGTGAYVSGLRRTGLGSFDNPDEMVGLAALEQRVGAGDDPVDWLLPTARALSAFPSLSVNRDMAFYLRQGQPVLVPKAPTEGWVRVYDEANHLFAVAEILDDGRVAPRRLLHLP